MYHLGCGLSLAATHHHHRMEKLAVMSHQFKPGDYVEYKEYNTRTFLGLYFGVVTEADDCTLLIRITESKPRPDLVGFEVRKFPKNVQRVKGVVAETTIRELMS